MRSSFRSSPAIRRGVVHDLSSSPAVHHRRFITGGSSPQASSSLHVVWDNVRGANDV
jgi:hypothetical protein